MLLEAHGCKYHRDARHGGHEIWLCPGRKPLSVPKNPKGEGTLQKILKDSGVRSAQEAVDKDSGAKAKVTPW
jgi:hypothetical protein